MKISILDKLLCGVAISHEDLLIDFAVGIFSDGKVTLGRAARIAKMSPPDFQQMLGNRHIPIHYDDYDLEQDLMVVREQSNDYSK